jgi:hypothetical protein
LMTWMANHKLTGLCGSQTYAPQILVSDNSCCLRVRVFIDYNSQGFI